MKYRSIVILGVCVSLAATASAQTSNQKVDSAILGSGTPNFIPRFSGTRTISNSIIFQSGNGNIGIGTTTPDSTVRVFNTSSVEQYGIYATLSNNTINFSSAIRGDALGITGGIGGVIGTTYSPQGWGVNGVALDSEGSGYGVSGSVAATSGTGGGGGVIGTTQLTTGFTTGVRGESDGTSGGGVGVFGEAFSPDGTGGFFQNNSVGGIGLSGVTYSTSGFAVGAEGIAVSTTGAGVAVFGQAWSPDGAAGLFNNVAAGNIIVGGVGQPGVNVFRVDGHGRVFADGGFQPNGADFAESMAVAGNRSKYGAGDLLVIDPSANRRVALAHNPYSTLVAGIYSTKPGMLGTTRKVDESAPQNEVPLAVVGIVPCKVTTENGPIRVGDLLVTSSTPGRAMKGTDRNRMLGAVVGKALEPLRQGTGVIQVLVTLQ
jgi:hypothetical protein